MKQNGEKISALTAYDFLMARYLEESGIDISSCRRFVRECCTGKQYNAYRTMDEMVYHAKIVKKAIRTALMVVDLPFMSYHVDLKESVRNCGHVMKETGADAVKLEGGERIAEVVKHLVGVGIPVMGHLGLTPQAINIFGTYKRAEPTRKKRDRSRKTQKFLQEAGCFAIVLEKIPAALAANVTKSLKIPTIGIGAGINCDGQILVTYDMLGMTEMFHPRFVRRYRRCCRTFKKCV